MNEKKRHGRPRSRFTAKEILGYLAIITVLGGLLMVILKLLAPPAEEGTYNFYESPIMPLSSLTDAENVEAERLVTLDFGIYEEEEFRSQEEVLVTDAYILTNPTETDVTVELSWGFDTRFQAWDTDLIPVLTAGGVPVQGRIFPDAGGDGSLLNAKDFQAYAKALTERDLLAEAMAPVPEWDVPVKVYHFYDIAYEGNQPNVWLNVTAQYGETTNLWVRTYGAVTQDKDEIEIIFMTGEDAWLYVIGDDLENLTINGSLYRNLGGIEQYPEAEGVTCQLETYESTFMECLWEAAEDYVPGDEMTPGMEQVTEQMRYDYALRQIVGSGRQNPGGFHRMDDLFDHLYINQCMIYWVFSVEIPAGGSVTVSATYRKQSSFNSGDARHGYDIATTLGSNLNFIGQRVMLKNTDLITITKDGTAQNLGIDLNAGVLEVTLDMTQERYFLDLLRAE